MSRRANLPGAAELFRVTGTRPPEPEEEAPDERDGAASAGEEPPAPVPLRRGGGGAPARAGSARAAAVPAPDAPSGPRRRQPSGRERHDEKITVYISPEELHDLEHARLVLRREHGVRADRGRIVREALAVVLSDLEAHGADSDLVRRLREQ